MADFWFGNLRKAGYYPAPNTDMDASAVGETDVMTFADGGAFVGQSDGTHKEFSMDWGVQERSVMNFLNEYRNGVNGNGLLYFADPFAANILPPHWANPPLTCAGWPSLTQAGDKPTRIAAASLTNKVTNPQFVTLTGGTQDVRTNLVPNPNFETNVTGWTVGTNVTFATSTAQKMFGTQSGVMTRSNTTQGNGFVTRTMTGLTIGAVYTMSFYVYGGTGTYTHRVGNVTTPFNAPGATWVRYSQTFTATATSQFLYVTDDQNTAPVVGSTLYIDGVMLDAGPDLRPYFDGSFPSTPEFTYAWTGTAHGSTSVERGQTVAGITTESAVRSWKSPGGLTISNLSTQSVAFPAAFDNGQLNTVLVRARAVTPGSTLQIFALTGNPILSLTSQFAWYRVGPLTATQVTMYFSPRNGAVGSTDARIEVSHVLTTSGTYTGPYFDGSTKFVDGTAPYWNGTPNASTSSMARTAGNGPNYSAQYTVSGFANQIPQRKLTLLIPSDRDLVLGFSGSATGGGVLRLQPITRDGSYGPIQDLTLLDPNGTTRMNARILGSEYAAVQVYISSTTDGTATVALQSGKAIYCLPKDTPTMTGDHLEGEGHTGFRFASAPAMSYIQAADGHRYVTSAAKFVEMEAWL